VADDLTNPPLSWFFVFLLAAILFGPIVYALVKGRKGNVPEHEDPRGDVGWTVLIKEWWDRQRPTGT
jgi:hypothetical protein